MSNFQRSFAVERSRHDFQYFYEWLGYTWGEHIGEWHNLYVDRKGAQVHRTCIIAPRDHSKSTTLRMVMLHHCLYNEWRDKPFTIWLFSASKELAANRLEEIRNDMQRHKELSKFIDTRRGGKLNLRFTNGAWIKATGVGAAIRGEHPACICMDDVLNEGDILPETLRNWFRKKITPMLSPGTSLYVVGTPMSMTDLYHTDMLENPAWKTGIWSALPNWDEHKADEEVKLECLWPEYRPLNFLMEQKDAMGELAFTQEYLCKVIDEEAQVYQREHTRANMEVTMTLEQEKVHEDSKYVIGFDPSHGLGKDYSVMVVMRQDKEGDLHLVNIWRRNDFPPAKQVDMIIEMCKKYGNPVFAAEDVGFQRLYESLLHERNAVVDFKASKVSNRALKQALLNRLRVWFEQKRIHFPFGNDATRRTVKILLDELDTHAWKDGNIVDLGRHNDTVMALAHAVDQFYTQSKSLPMFGGTADASGWNKPDRQPVRKTRGTASGRYRRLF